MNPFIGKYCLSHNYTLLRLTIVLVFILSGINLNSDNDVPPVTFPSVDEPPPMPKPDNGVNFEYGRCEIDYTESDFGAKIWKYIKEHFEEDVDHLFGLEHHDVYIEPPLNIDDIDFGNSSTWAQASTQNEKYAGRGFYAHDLNALRWLDKIRAWQEGNFVVYVRGHMRDKMREKDLCTKWGEGQSRDMTEDAVQVVLAHMVVKWRNFHIVKRNCQHWAFFILTSEDLNQVENPEDYVPVEE